MGVEEKMNVKFVVVGLFLLLFAGGVMGAETQLLAPHSCLFDASQICQAKEFELVSAVRGFAGGISSWEAVYFENSLNSSNFSHIVYSNSGSGTVIDTIIDADTPDIAVLSQKEGGKVYFGYRFKNLTATYNATLIIKSYNPTTNTTGTLCSSPCDQDMCTGDYGSDLAINGSELAMVIGSTANNRTYVLSCNVSSGAIIHSQIDAETIVHKPKSLIMPIQFNIAGLDCQNQPYFWTGINGTGDAVNRCSRANAFAGDLANLGPQPITGGTDNNLITVWSNATHKSNAVSIYWDSDAEGNSDLYYVNKSGSPNIKLTSTSDNETLVSIFQDSKELVFTVYNKSNILYVDFSCPHFNNATLGQADECQTRCSDGTQIGDCSTSTQNLGFYCNPDGNLVLDLVKCSTDAITRPVSPSLKLIIEDQGSCSAFLGGDCSVDTVTPDDRLLVYYSIDGKPQLHNTTNTTEQSGFCNFTINSSDGVSTNYSQQIMPFDESFDAFSFLLDEGTITQPYFNQTVLVECNNDNMTARTNVSGWFRMHDTYKHSEVEYFETVVSSASGISGFSLSDREDLFIELEVEISGDNFYGYDLCYLMDFESIVTSPVLMTQTLFEGIDSTDLPEGEFRIRQKFKHNLGRSVPPATYDYGVMCVPSSTDHRIPTVIKRYSITIDSFCNSSDLTDTRMEFITDSVNLSNNSGVSVVIQPNSSYISAFVKPMTPTVYIQVFETDTDELISDLSVCNGTIYNESGAVGEVFAENIAQAVVLEAHYLYPSVPLADGNYSMNITCGAPRSAQCYADVTGAWNFSTNASVCDNSPDSCGMTSCVQCGFNVFYCPDDTQMFMRQICNQNAGCDTNPKGYRIACRGKEGFQITGFFESPEVPCSSKEVKFKGALVPTGNVTRDFSNFTCNIGLANSNYTYIWYNSVKTERIGRFGGFEYEFPDGFDRGVLDCNKTYTLSVDCTGGFVDFRFAQLVSKFDFRIMSGGDCPEPDGSGEVAVGFCSRSTPPLFCNEDKVLVSKASECGCGIFGSQDYDLAPDGNKIFKETCSVATEDFFLMAWDGLTTNPLLLLVIAVLILLRESSKQSGGNITVNTGRRFRRR